MATNPVFPPTILIRCIEVVRKQAQAVPSYYQCFIYLRSISFSFFPNGFLFVVGFVFVFLSCCFDDADNDRVGGLHMKSPLSPHASPHAAWGSPACVTFVPGQMPNYDQWTGELRGGFESAVGG